MLTAPLTIQYTFLACVPFLKITLEFAPDAKAP